MIVISDTSPINYLILVGHVEILPVLFGHVMIPPAVFAELQRAETPPTVRDLIDDPPAWLSVRSPGQIDQAVKLGLGEVEAISLAVEMHATYLLADDRRARRAARDRGLTVAGTLGVLELAAERGLIDFPTAIATLRGTSFHVSERVLARVLAADAERRAKGGN